MNDSNRTTWFSVTVIYMALLLWGSLKPPAASVGEQDFVREMLHNLLHVPAYAGLTLVLYKAIKSSEQRPKNGILEIRDIEFGARKAGMLIAIIYGVVIEQLQGMVPGRYPSTLDIFLNIAGAGGMASILEWFNRRELKGGEGEKREGEK